MAEKTKKSVETDETPRFRNRIVEFRRVPAGELEADPRNWRRHSDAQRESVAAMLEGVGFAGAVVARRTDDGRLVIVDGHLRAEIDPSADVPVLVVDLNDEEAGQVLATFDPIGGMADIDRDALGRLLETVEGKIDPVLMDEIREWANIDEDGGDQDGPDGRHYGDHDGSMRSPSDYRPTPAADRTRIWVLEIPRTMYADHVARVERLAAAAGTPGNFWPIIEKALDRAEGGDAGDVGADDSSDADG